MSTSQADLLYLQAGFPELKNYLLSEVLYYPLIGNMPRLTIGGVLLAKRRLGDEITAAHLMPKLATVKSTWRSAWNKKAAAELNSRLRLWSGYLDDYRNKPKEYVNDYSYEVRSRVMIELLTTEIDQSPAELVALDQLLRTKFTKGKFIWGNNLKNKFPEDEFWFLYGKLK